MSINFIPNKLSFKNFCEKHKIDLEIRKNDREWEHIQTCSCCKHGYVLYWIQNIIIEKKSVDYISDSWLLKTESSRQYIRKSLSSSIMRYFKSHIWKRAPSAYQIFLKDVHVKYPSIKSIEFKHQTSHVAVLWREMDIEEKQKYEQQSKLQKLTFYEHKKNLHSIIKYLSKEFRRIKKSKSVVYKKPLNSYMTYLADRWKDEKSKSLNNLTYHQVMKLASFEWNNDLSDVEKEYYISKSKIKI